MGVPTAAHHHHEKMLMSIKDLKKAMTMALEHMKGEPYEHDPYILQ